MTPMKTYVEPFELFQSLATTYGDVLTNGGTPSHYFRGIRLAQRLARTMNVDVETVLETVRENHQHSQGGGL